MAAGRETVTTLVAGPLTAAAFERYGRVIEAATAREAAGAAAVPAHGDGAALVGIVNQGTSRRHEAVPALDLQRNSGRAVLALYDAQARAFPFPALGLERHQHADQVFLPLGAARRCVLLVAPPGPAPAPGDCEAFVSDGMQGVLIAAGTWHHGLLALDAGAWAVLERRALDGTVDCDECQWPEPLLLQLPG